MYILHFFAQSHNTRRTSLQWALACNERLCARRIESSFCHPDATGTTLECPTNGTAIITLFGYNFVCKEEFHVTMNGHACSNVTLSESGDQTGTSTSSLTFLLPGSHALVFETYILHILTHHSSTVCFFYRYVPSARLLSNPIPHAPQFSMHYPAGGSFVARSLFPVVAHIIA
jgi:hypothetical protein